MSIMFKEVFMEVAIQIKVVTDNNTHQKRTKASGNKLPHPLKIH